MYVSVFGLGYVGCVSAACLAKLGQRVIGVDVSPEKVQMLNAGKATIVEEQIGELTSQAVQAGDLCAIISAQEAVASTEISLICVGTPSKENGSLDLRYVTACCQEIAAGLAAKSDYHLVVMRSTMLPGSMRGTVIPLLEEVSGKKAGCDFGVAINPEFLREGSSVRDFFYPPYTVVGAQDERSAELLAQLYSGIEAPFCRVQIETAEMIKYASNSFHALKICFANELGRISKSAGVDAHELMDLFCRDDKLNVSSAYLKPGFAFGGSCLPKDVRALNYYAKSVDAEVPVLASILPSNQAHLEQALRLVMRQGRRRVGIIGLAFKAGTDDLRESPLVALAERLIGRGYPVKIFDPQVRISHLFGANRQYIEKEIPHIEKLMTESLAELLEFAEVVIVGQKSAELEPIYQDHKEIIELERVAQPHSEIACQGLCW